MKQEKLNEILRLHKLWLENKQGGKRLVLRYSDLRHSDLRGSNLSGSDLRHSDLRHSDLSGSNLRGSNLSGSDLRHSDLRGSNLSGSDLRHSDLRHSDLSGSDLRYSNLPLKEILRKGIIVKHKMTGWKKCQNNILVKLEIPKGAIVFSINNDKCRTNIAKVVEVIGGKTGVSTYDKNYIYRKGKTYKIDNFDLMYNIESSTGIHFFRTRKEAEHYNG